MTHVVLLIAVISVSVFYGGPKTFLLPAWPRDAERLDTAVLECPPRSDAVPLLTVLLTAVLFP